MTKLSSTSDRIYRLDRFTVPKQAREDFLSKVKETHELLRNQPGFVQDFLLEQTENDEEITLVTLVEWQDKKAVENAGKAVKTMHKSSGFNPKRFTKQLGIEADLGIFKSTGE